MARRDSIRPAFAMRPVCCWSFRSTDRAAHRADGSSRTRSAGTADRCRCRAASSNRAKLRAGGAARGARGSGAAGADARVLGLLTPLDIPVSGFRLHPIVAVMDAASPVDGGRRRSRRHSRSARRRSAESRSTGHDRARTRRTPHRRPRSARRPLRNLGRHRDGARGVPGAARVASSGRAPKTAALANRRFHDICDLIHVTGDIFVCLAGLLHGSK